MVFNTSIFQSGVTTIKSIVDVFEDFVTKKKDEKNQAYKFDEKIIDDTLEALHNEISPTQFLEMKRIYILLKIENYWKHHKAKNAMNCWKRKKKIFN